ncbi:hypothetical protein NRK67_05675 [Fusobacteria bacterium ZRK30]|nr:hypothetical protein NRK67_05675 [Fusobacteria bacterium ZRK30]
MEKNLEVLESMIYYWSTLTERGKVGEEFLASIYEEQGMKDTYNDDFDDESVSKVLSAIANREAFKGRTENESRFWNNNMWMLEDMEYMNKVIYPLKKLNLEGLGDGEVIFLPLHLDLFYKKGNTLYINFFMIKPDEINGTDKLTIEDVEVKEWIKKNMG